MDSVGFGPLAQYDKKNFMVISLMLEVFLKGLPMETQRKSTQGFNVEVKGMLDIGVSIYWDLGYHWFLMNLMLWSHIVETTSLKCLKLGGLLWPSLCTNVPPPPYRDSSSNNKFLSGILEKGMTEYTVSKLRFNAAGTRKAKERNLSVENTEQINRTVQ